MSFNRFPSGLYDSPTYPTNQQTIEQEFAGPEGMPTNFTVNYIQ